MRHLKNFEEYVQKGIIRKISPDKSRSNFLIQEVENSIKGLREIVEKIKN